MKKTLKYIINVAVILLIAVGTLYFLFRDRELSKIIVQIKEADFRYLLGALAFMGMYVVSESFIMKYLLHNLEHEISIVKCILISHIGFFFGAITPSASGGQPVQVFYMSKLGIDTLVSSFIVVIITLCFKLTLVLLCIVLSIFEPDVMFGSIGEIPILFTYGVLATLAFLVFLFMCIFKTSLADGVVSWGIKVGTKLHIIRHPERTLGKAIRSIRQYEKAAAYIRHNLNVLVVPMLITIVQRLLYFSVTYMVLRALHIECSWAQIIGMQVVLSLSVDILPLPGASGANESVFFILFTMLFSEATVLSALLFNRGITYYLILVVGGIVSLIGHWVIMKSYHRAKEARKSGRSSKKRKIVIAKHYVSMEEFRAVARLKKVSRKNRKARMLAAEKQKRARGEVK